MIPDWLKVHAWWLATLSLLLAMVAALMVGRWLVRLPADHFLLERRMPEPGSPRTFLRQALCVSKNIAGFGLIAIGAVMCLPLVPGPGLLVLLVGLSLTSFPGKRKWELRLLRSPLALRPINWLRAQAGRPALQMPSSV